MSGSDYSDFDLPANKPNGAIALNHHDFKNHKIEEEIDNFLESFKYRSSILDRRQSNDSGSSHTSGWTSSVETTTDDQTTTTERSTATTDSPDREHARLLDPDAWIKRQGIIDASRRISEWAWATSIEDFDENPSGRPSGMGENLPKYNVIDVAKILQSKFVFLSGGKARNGAPILTFPDCPGQPEPSDEDYRKVTTYLCTLLPLDESEAGFVLVIDRRQDGWGSVKTILHKISGFFPTHIQVVFLLQPKGFFQRAFADYRSKFVKEELEFKVVLSDSGAEMLDYIDPSQLTVDVGGSLVYDPNEWTEHRSAVEKFAKNTEEIVARLNKCVRRFEEMELPNTQELTESTIRDHKLERTELVDDLKSAAIHGDTLLKCIKGDNSDNLECRLVHVLELERLLVQLEETQKKFTEFWHVHEEKLRQCLQLRQFEEEFKLVQFSIERRLETLETKMKDTGANVAQTEQLIAEFEEFEGNAQRDLEKTEKMRNQGEQLIRDDHYAVDSIRPKCIELQRMCQQYKELMRRRREVLTRSHELHDRLDKANKWCSKGVDMLASQPLDQCQGGHAQDALRELENFLALSRELKLSNPKEFRQLFESVMTSETRSTVHEVLKRIEDVQSMCAKRRESLQKMVGSRPPQATPAKQTSPPGPPNTPGLPPREPSDTTDGAGGRRPGAHHFDKAARLQHAGSSGTSTASHSSLCASDSLSSTDSHTQRSSVSSMSTSSLPDLGDNIQAKRRLVMNELIDTEKAYVTELQQILHGYYYQFESKGMRELIPPELIGKQNILFGNLEQIYRFHNDLFLQELQNCREFPSRVGRCFVNRREEFQMYSIYCQNKPKSEALRMQAGDNNPFFKECQRRLDHKLPLGAYLLKPVQRITKYQLLLREMLRFVGEDHDLEETVQQALDTMLHVLAYLNDSMHQVSIVGFTENLSDQGRLLIHGDFSVWTEHKKEKIRDLRFKPMHRHVFLYERSLLLCKKKEDVHNQDNSIYVFKNKLILSRVGLTENIKGDKRKFELWSRGREEVFIIQAPNMEVKEQWVKEIKRVLMSQFDQLKVNRMAQNKSVEDLTAQHKRNASDPGEYNSVDNWRPQPNNNTSTVPVGLEMSSPVESPSSGSADVAEDEGWSSGEFSNTDEESSQEQYIPKIEPSYRQHFVVLGDYYPVDTMELQLHEGDVVEVIRVGTNGWWFARHLATTEEGWVPSTYLEPAPQHLSTSSSDSLNPGGHLSHSQSRTSFGSKYNLASPMEETTV